MAAEAAEVAAPLSSAELGDAAFAPHLKAAADNGHKGRELVAEARRTYAAEKAAPPRTEAPKAAATRPARATSSTRSRATQTGGTFRAPRASRLLKVPASGGGLVSRLAVATVLGLLALEVMSMITGRYFSFGLGGGRAGADPAVDANGVPLKYVPLTKPITMQPNAAGTSWSVAAGHGMVQ